MSNKVKKLTGAFLSLLFLASCSTTNIELPTNYKDPLYPNISGDTTNPIVQNNWQQYYNGVLTSDGVYQNAVKQMLLAISKIGHNNTNGTNGTDVSSILNDNFDDYSVSSGTQLPDALTNGSTTNLLERNKKSLESASRSGTYNKDNLFYETKYVTGLKEAFTLNSDFDESAVKTAGQLIVPSMKYGDIYGGNYEKYMTNNLYDDTRINYLTSEYIYTKSFASIGNAQARNVQVIALTDRGDEPGSALKLLNAYIRDYITGTKSDPDFLTLSRLWKGISPDIITGIDKENPTRYDTRYPNSVVLTNTEEQWLKDNGLITSDDSFTLAGKVASDEKKLVTGIDNPRLVDSALESTYTGTYAYDYTIGVRKALDAIATKSMVTKGIYLKSDGLSSIPSTLKDRIFDSKLSISKSQIAEMKSNPGTTPYDITTYENDGFRYVTTAGTTSSDSGLLYYDAGSKTYYLTRILDVVNTNALASTNTDSIYDTAAKREQIAREVAYAMSTTGTYKTDSSIYWLRRTKINYSDDDFLTYMKTNYKDLFKTDSGYDSEPKIILG